jgi:hypothetical protein
MTAITENILRVKHRETHEKTTVSQNLRDHWLIAES